MAQNLINKTAPYQMMLRAKLLTDSVVWFDTFKNNPELRKMIITMIQKDQLTDKGIDSKGQVIGYYSPVTAMINKLKKANSHYTLHDTGDFYNSMFVVVLNYSLVIGGDTQKMEDQEWWHDEIINLTQENLIIFIDEIRIKYIEYARKILFQS
jgi:hypothetical protein